MSSLDGSTFLNGATINVDELINIFNKLPIQPQSSSAGAASTASTTFIAANSKTFAVAADDYIIWNSNLTYSVDDATCTGAIKFTVDGVTIGNSYPLRSTGILASNGLVMPQSFSVHVFDLAAGSHIFKIEVQRTSGSGTLYLANSYSWFAVGKRRS
ncbi:hypothetical protein EP7_004283 [Isosphaeraceae bacterium EP7]